MSTPDCPGRAALPRSDEQVMNPGIWPTCPRPRDCALESLRNGPGRSWCRGRRTDACAGSQARAEPIAVGTEWTVPLLERFDAALDAHARRLQLDTYPIQYEVITAAQMIDLCSTVGMRCITALELRQAPARPGAHLQEA